MLWLSIYMAVGLSPDVKCHNTGNFCVVAWCLYNFGLLNEYFHDFVFEEKAWSKKHFNSVSVENICSMKQHKTITLNDSDGQSVHLICCQAQGRFYQLIKPLEISDCFQLYFTKLVFNCWPHWSHSLLRNTWISIQLFFWQSALCWEMK